MKRIAPLVLCICITPGTILPMHVTANGFLNSKCKGSRFLAGYPFIVVRMRSYTGNCRDPFEMMNMPAGYRNSRTGYPLNHVLMSLIYRGYREIPVNMRDAAGGRLGNSGVLVIMSVIIGGNAGKRMGMNNRPTVPCSDIDAMRMIAALFLVLKNIPFHRN